MYFPSICDTEHKVYGLFWNIFWGVPKTAIYVSRGTVWGKTIFRRTYVFLSILGHWANYFWRFWQSIAGVEKTAFYVSRGTVWGKLCFLKKVYFIFIIAHWDKDFWPFVGKISAVPSKLHSTFPQEHFEENIFFREKWKFQIIFGHWAK